MHFNFYSRLLLFCRKRSNLLKSKKSTPVINTAPHDIHNSEFTSSTQKESLLPPGYRGTYPYSNTGNQQVHRKGIKSLN